MYSWSPSPDLTRVWKCQWPTCTTTIISPPKKKYLPSIYNNLKEYCKPRPLQTGKTKMSTFLPVFHSLLESLLSAGSYWLSGFSPHPPHPHLGKSTNPPPSLCPEAQHSRPLFSFLPLSCYNAAIYIYLQLFIYRHIFLACFVAICVLSPQPSLKGL